ncbi:hypothetical protein C0Q70_00696 [Pomacea canaliculata]|uniref:Uncharacterized protein n=1 Tax=Pomacea canaliculata TaxID=400727 RepID=A0A2T7PXD2_POMCA|nr:hypothetical protein C0Q70_00696 [Pomacea canaliculata]
MSKSSYDSSQTVQLSSGVYSTTNLGGATVASSSVLTPSPASTYISSLATWTTQANMDYQVRSQAVSSGISVASSTGTGAIFSTLAPVLRSTGVAEVLPGSETSFTSITPQSSSRVTQADSVTSSFGSTAGAVVSAASINPSSTLSPSSVQPSGVTLVMTSSKTSNTGNWASCSGGQVSCGSSSSELGKTSLTTSLLSTSSAAAPSTRLSAAASEAAQRTTAAAQSTAQSTPLSPSASFIDASTARSDSTTVFASSASAFNNTPSSTNSLTNKGGKTALVSLSQLLILLAVNGFNVASFVEKQAGHCLQGLLQRLQLRAQFLLEGHHWIHSRPSSRRLLLLPGLVRQVRCRAALQSWHQLQGQARVLNVQGVNELTLQLDQRGVVQTYGYLFAVYLAQHGGLNLVNTACHLADGSVKRGGDSRDDFGALVHVVLPAPRQSFLLTLQPLQLLHLYLQRPVQLLQQLGCPCPALLRRGFHGDDHVIFVRVVGRLLAKRTHKLLAWLAV